MKVIQEKSCLKKIKMSLFVWPRTSEEAEREELERRDRERRALVAEEEREEYERRVALENEEYEQKMRRESEGM